MAYPNIEKKTQENTLSPVGTDGPNQPAKAVLIYSEPVKY